MKLTTRRTIRGTILGGVLAGVADASIPGLIGGTPLGPTSSSSPITWTVIGAKEVAE